MFDNVKYYFRTVGARGLLAAAAGKLRTTPVSLRIDRPDVKFPFFLRVPSSDVQVYYQVFICRGYELEAGRQPAAIIDAGANIGLASIFFANRFPDARIIAVEPEESNLEALRKNIAPYGNISAVSGAVWCEDAIIELVDPGSGKWGLMTRPKNGLDAPPGRMVREVRGMTIDTLMKEQGIGHIDILKMDIEGAELEVLRDSAAWIEKVDVLILELHEHIKPGCIRSFENILKYFDNKRVYGEHVFLTRNARCPAGT